MQAVKLGDQLRGRLPGRWRFLASMPPIWCSPRPSGQTPIKIAGTDEGALWDAGSAEEVSGWGSTERVREPGRHAPRRKRGRDPGLDLHGRLRHQLRSGHHGLRGIPERRCGHLLRRQRRTAPGTAPGRRLSAGRYHRLGQGLRRGRLPGRLHAGRGPDHAVADLAPTSRASAFPPPRSSAAAASPARRTRPWDRGQATAATRRKKCKRIHNRKKRKRCRKKARSA